MQALSCLSGQFENLQVRLISLALVLSFIMETGLVWSWMAFHIHIHISILLLYAGTKTQTVFCLQITQCVKAPFLKTGSFLYNANFPTCFIFILKCSSNICYLLKPPSFLRGVMWVVETWFSVTAQTLSAVIYYDCIFLNDSPYLNLLVYSSCHKNKPSS